jgi:hypothetical protein
MQKIEVFYCEITDLNGYKNRIITTDEKRLSNFRRMYGGGIGGIRQWSETLNQIEFEKIKRNKYFK